MKKHTYKYPDEMRKIVWVFDDGMEFVPADVCKAAAQDGYISLDKRTKSFKVLAKWARESRSVL